MTITNEDNNIVSLLLLGNKVVLAVLTPGGFIIIFFFTVDCKGLDRERFISGRREVFILGNI